MNNKQLPEARVKPPVKGASKDWIRLPAIHGDPSPKGTQKLTDGSANPPYRRPVGAPLGNHNHSGGNMPLEWFGDFGWTTSAAVSHWFDEAFEVYKQKNSLKLRAMKRFHPVGDYEFRSPTYTLVDNQG